MISPSAATAQPRPSALPPFCNRPDLSPNRFCNGQHPFLHHQPPSHSRAHPRPGPPGRKETTVGARGWGRGNSTFKRGPGRGPCGGAEAWFWGRGLRVRTAGGAAHKAAAAGAPHALRRARDTRRAPDVVGASVARGELSRWAEGRSSGSGTSPPGRLRGRRPLPTRRQGRHVGIYESKPSQQRPDHFEVCKGPRMGA